MLERRTARSAAAKPKATAATAPKAKTTGPKAASQAAAGKPAAKRRVDETREYIQRRAYELWESEGRPAGRDQAHWLQAESEIARVRGQRAGLIR
jgi:hypothetical protein